MSRAKQGGGKSVRLWQIDVAFLKAIHIVESNRLSGNDEY